MLVLHILLGALVFPLAIFTFGGAVLTRFTRLDAEERFASAWAVGVGVLAASEYVAFLLDVDQTGFNAATLALMFAVAGYCQWSTKILQIADCGLQIGNSNPQSAIRNPRSADVLRSPLWPLPALWVLGYVYLLVIQSLLPLYVGSSWFGDWCMHWHTTQIFRGNVTPVTAAWGEYTLASRTPVFNLTTAFAQSLLGDEFWVYQITATLLNYCFVAPLYLVLRDLAGARAARLALVLVPLNLWMLHLAWFTWPKMLAAYFLLLGLHAYLQFVQRRQAEPATAWRYFLGFWTCSWAGFLTHQVGLLYLAPLALHALYLAWRDRGAVWLGVRQVLSLAAVFALPNGAWYRWLYLTFGSAGTVGQTPVTVMESGERFSPWSILSYVGYDLWASLVPMHLLQGLLNNRPLPILYDGLNELYFSLFTGAVTLSLLAFLVAKALLWLFRPARPERTRPLGPCGSALCLFLLSGILGGAVLHPSRTPHGIAHAALFPAAILLVGLAWMLLAKQRGGVAQLVALGMVVEFLCMFWTHIWLVVESPDVLDPYRMNMVTKRENQAVFLNDLLHVPEPSDADAVRERVVNGQVQAAPFPLGIAAAIGLQVLFIFFTLDWLREEKDVEVVSSG